MTDNKIIKVMAVDNDDSVLDMYRHGLTAKGYSVQTFLNPVQVKEYLFQTTEVPDVILIDMMMPDTEALTLMHEIHSAAKTSSVPIIAVSTIKDATILTDVFIFGAADYLVKPFDINVLDIKIKNVIKAAQKRNA